MRLTFTTRPPSSRAVAVALLGLVAAACASAPPAPPKPLVIPHEQKLTWIFQLEDQRLLKLPDPPAPPPAPVVKGRKPAPLPPPPTSAPDLAKLATDAEARIRRRAAIAIGRVGLKEGVPVLAPMLTDSDSEVRQAAAFALGLLGDRSASAALLPLLSDQDPLVRGRAAEALGSVGAEDAAPAIGKVAADYARTASVSGMAPDDERWPAPPEAEAFKLSVFALVRLRAYRAAGSRRARQREAGLDLVAGRVCAPAHRRSARRAGTPRLDRGQGPLHPGVCRAWSRRHQGRQGRRRAAAAHRRRLAAARGRGLGDPRARPGRRHPGGRAARKDRLRRRHRRQPPARSRQRAGNPPRDRAAAQRPGPDHR